MPVTVDYDSVASVLSYKCEWLLYAMVCHHYKVSLDTLAPIGLISSCILFSFIGNSAGFLTKMQRDRRLEKATKAEVASNFIKSSSGSWWAITRMPHLHS